MNEKDRKRLDKALNIVLEVKEDIMIKIDNLESNDMEHLPIYETLTEDDYKLEEIENLLIEAIEEF